ncbi:MAG: SdpI family protein [Coprobacillus sp.]
MSIITISLSLFIPILMSISGLIFIFFPPKKLNSIVGYRTKTSMSSQEAWDYAQKLRGKTWLILGVIGFICSYLLLQLLSVSESTIVITIISLQLVVLYSSYIFVEKSLKKKF